MFPHHISALHSFPPPPCFSCRSRRSVLTRRRTSRSERISASSGCRAKKPTSSRAGTSSVMFPAEVNTTTSSVRPVAGTGCPGLVEKTFFVVWSGNVCSGACRVPEDLRRSGHHAGGERRVLLPGDDAPSGEGDRGQRSVSTQAPGLLVSAVPCSGHRGAVLSR